MDMIELGEPPQVTRTRSRVRMGKRWTREELAQDFDADPMSPYPFVLVTRREDGVRGTVKWDEAERRYFDFERTKG